MTISEKSILTIGEIQLKLFKVIDKCCGKKCYNKISDDIKKPIR